MQIRHQALGQQVQKKIAPLYILIGQDNYLLDQAFCTIKTALKKSFELDEKIITLQTPGDWQKMIDETNHYSLFADRLLINGFHEKKTLATQEKNLLTKYLSSVNNSCTIIIRAPHLPAKLIQTVAAFEQAVVVLNQPLSSAEMKQWISKQLKHIPLDFEAQVPDVIHQYTQGNMLACAQVIEKIGLSNEINSLITVQQALEQVSNQCDHTPFELIDACLLGQADKALQIIKLAAKNKTEPTFILWMLSQEIRVSLQLLHAVQAKLDIKTVSSQLKLWPQRMGLYQTSLKRHNTANLTRLLQYCQVIDERIKSNASSQVWNALENLALSLSLGQLIGEAQGVFS
ncbi:MAG: DNA polymerase III subunit delta [Legionella sp.]|nr:DNA polymerase III subunit delta [Legionella sp.]